jgi:hypothetical protein
VDKQTGEVEADDDLEKLEAEANNLLGDADDNDDLLADEDENW